MTTRTAADPASPNLKDALTQLSVAVRELVGSQAHAQLMRAATGSDVNAGQSIYQPSKEPTAQTQSRNILSSEEQPPADSYMNVTTVLDNDDYVPDLAAASDSDDDSDDDVPSKKQEGNREDDSSHDNGCNDGEPEPLIHRPSTLHVRRNATWLCSVIGCCRPSSLMAHFADGTAALVCCELCIGGEGHTEECEASSLLWQRRQQRLRRRQQEEATRSTCAEVTLSPSSTEQYAHRKAHPLTQSIDQLPHNFMTTSESVDSCLRTRIGLHDHEAKPMTMKVCGTFQEAIKSHWDSCASACFESSLEHCVPNSFVKLEKKIVTADGGCNSDGMAWRRYHVPITEEWIVLGDEYGFDLRQADVITFAMPPIVATKFPTPVSIIAAPVAKGLFISTLIAAGYHEPDSIRLHRKPDLTYPLHHKANGLPYVAFVDDKLVRQRGLRMISHFDLLPYTDDKAMKMLSTQWKYHDPAGIYWTVVNECFALMTVGNVPRTLSSRVDTNTTVDVDRAAPAIYDELHNYVGWPPSDNSAVTVLESTPSLKTVDSLFYTGEHESSKPRLTPPSVCPLLSNVRKRRGNVLNHALALSMDPSSMSLWWRADCLQHCSFHKMPRVVQSVTSRRHYISRFH